MSYSIQVIRATQATFRGNLANGMEVLQLDGGVKMIALGSTARKLLGLHFLSLTDEGIEEPPPSDLACALVSLLETAAPHERAVGFATFYPSIKFENNAASIIAGNATAWDLQ